MNGKCKNFCPLCFGLALGTVLGLSYMLLGWFSINGWGRELVGVLSSLYIGYASTILGGIIGGVWGFVEGLIGGTAFAYLYNLFTKKHD